MLRDLSRAFRAKSDALRQTAARNIRAIVGTVAFMTVAILALPPLIDVVEDRILGAFGYQTSQIDTRAETNAQAVEVQVRNQALANLIDQRDQSLQNLRALAATPYSAFAPESITGGLPLQLDVRDFAHLNGVEVAVGSVLREAVTGPFIAVNTGSGWQVALGSEEELIGSALSVNAGPRSIDVAGFVGDRARLWSVNETGEVVQGFLDLIGYEDATRATHLHEINSPALTALALSFSDSLNGAGRFADAQLATSHLLLPDQDDIATPVVPDRSIVDLAWRAANIYALVQAPSGSMVWTLRDPSDSIERFFEQPIMTNGAALGFARLASGEPVAAAVSTDNGLILFQHNGAEWAQFTDPLTLRVRSSPYFPEYFVDIGNGRAAIGDQGQDIVIVDLASGTAEGTINVRHNDGFFDRAKLFARADGRMAIVIAGDAGEVDLSRADITERPLSSYIFNEADLLDILPVPEDPSDMLSLIGWTPGNATRLSIDPRPSSGQDQTAESAGLTVNADYMRTGLGSLTDAFENDWLFSQEIGNEISSLSFLISEWETNWTARETAALTLSRLRQAEDASDIWRNVSSISARLAVIALLVYLVNILVNLYRYNMRLAAFYQARADAIDMVLASGADLGSDGPAVLADLAKANTPEEVTFGNRPVPPTDTLINAMAEMAKLGRSGG